jgi:hypothetical protein
MSSLARLDRIKGSLLGGAVGDTLGAGIELLSLDDIRQRFGLFGVDDFVSVYGREGAIDDKVALFTNRTRDLGIVRVIAVHGRPRYVLEPGADAVDWAADIEGVSPGELAQSIREGALGRRVARLAMRQERRSREVLEAKVQALRERVQDAEAEAAMLQAELRARERDLARYED